MGIRFRCHHCQFELHVKDFQGGKKGKCPQCQGRFRIPASTSELSLVLEESTGSSEISSEDSVVPSVGEAVGADSQRSTSTITFSKASISNQASSPVATASADTYLNWSAFQNSSTAKWHVRPPSGGQYGPASSDIFYQWILENRVTGDSFVWREGWPEWKQASQVFAEHFPSQPEDILSVRKPDPLKGLAKSVPASSPRVKSVQLKKKRAEKRYTRMVVILAIVAVVLVVSLVVILMMPPTASTGTSQPAP